MNRMTPHNPSRRKEDGVTRKPDSGSEDEPGPAQTERDAITRDRIWASGYSAGRAATLRALPAEPQPPIDAPECGFGCALPHEHNWGAPTRPDIDVAHLIRTLTTIDSALGFDNYDWRRSPSSLEAFAHRIAAEYGPLPAATEPADGLRREDVDWVADLRKSPLHQCGHWLGGEDICVLPPGHERHAGAKP